MAKVVTCPNCGTRNTVPDQPPPKGLYMRCGICGGFLPHPPTTDQGTRAVAAATGGALLGWSIGGPPGALIGGIAGLLIGGSSEK